jgi:hypothetical protein
VLPLRSPSLYYSMNWNILPPASRRVPAAKQLLLALKNLHDAGMVHRGMS